MKSILITSNFLLYAFAVYLSYCFRHSIAELINTTPVEVMIIASFAMGVHFMGSLWSALLIWSALLKRDIVYLNNKGHSTNYPTDDRDNVTSVLLFMWEIIILVTYISIFYYYPLKFSVPIVFMGILFNVLFRETLNVLFNSNQKTKKHLRVKN